MPFYFLVYPEREVVKAYRLQKDKYRKIDDYSQGIWKGSIQDCAMEVAFSRIWL